jgi:hypothetical protein
MYLNSYKSDLLGLAGSGLCIVHCLLVPFLLCIDDSCCSSSSIDLLSPDYLFLGLSGTAVFFSSRKELNFKVRVLLWIFLAITIVGFSLEHFLAYPPYVLYSGSAGLVITHLYRLKRNKVCC